MADTDATLTSAERIKRLDMECVHLRRKLAEAEQRLEWARLGCEPDSWERLERDAAMPPLTYCTRRGIELEGEDGEMAPTNEAFALDIVRRAKKLAGVD